MKTDKEDAQGLLCNQLSERLISAFKNRIVDPVDYIEKHLWIKNLQNEIIRFNLKPLQHVHLQNKQKAKDEGRDANFLLLKYRRGGFTTLEQALSYAAIRTRSNIDCVTLAQTQPDTQKIFKIAKMFDELNDESPEPDSDSKVEIAYRDKRSSFYIGTAGGKSFGRGSNLYRVHGSEVAFWDMNYDATDNLVVGLKESARNGEVVLETTANGCDNWFYHTYQEAMEGKNNWIPLFYPWYIDGENQRECSDEKRSEILDTLDEEEIELILENKLTFEQIAWRRHKYHDLRTRFKQEYPGNWLEAFRISGEHFFDVEMIERLGARLKPPIEKKNNGEIWIWQKPVPGRRYTCGADAAEGLKKGDFSVAVMLDHETGEQVARIRAKCRPETFAKMCVDLCIQYNNAIYACEINLHGHSVMNTVQNHLRYRNLYYRPDHLKKMADGLPSYDKRPGFHTNVSTRPVLLDELNEALAEGWITVHDPIFFAEAKVFVDSGGKFEAKSGRNDDTIMATGIAWQARKMKKKGSIHV